jgi:hypothetical protein
VIAGAGGVATDWKGHPVGTRPGGRIVSWAREKIVRLEERRTRAAGDRG